MQSTALLLFESPVEAQGMAGTLREFDPAFEPRIVDDIAVLALVRGGERFRPVADDSAVSPTITSNAAAEPGNTLGQFGLTRAEHDVLVQVAQGKTNLQIANELGKQEGTVRGLQFRAIAALRRTLGMDLDIEERAETLVPRGADRHG